MAETPRGHSAPRLDERQRFVWKGAPGKPLSDAYHAWLEASWGSALGAVVVFYFAANALFGVGYWLSGGVENARAGSYSDAFFFSVQTLATIGYGKMAPVSTAAHLLVTFEALTGIVATAMMTGLLFAKFARPTARVLFSNVAVVSPYQGVPSLQFRLANERGNRIVEATLRVAVLRTEVTAEGVKLRRILDLTMMRERTAIFALTWTAIHAIDAQSPLSGLTARDLEEQGIELVATVTGLDETFAQTIHARHLYRWDDLRYGARFVDIISELPDGRREIDYLRFHDIKPA